MNRIWLQIYREREKQIDIKEDREREKEGKNWDRMIENQREIQGKIENIESVKKRQRVILSRRAEKELENWGEKVIER